MKTADQIIAYIELELADAYDQYDEYKTVDPQQALFHRIRIGVLLNLLEAIK